MRGRMRGIGVGLRDYLGKNMAKTYLTHPVFRRMLDFMDTPNSLIEAIKFFDNADNAIEYLANKRWLNGVECLYCEAKEPMFLATRKIWKCRSCRKQFSVKVGTIFEDSPLPLGKWLTATWLISNCKNGVSSYEIARDIQVTQKSAWFMLQRIRKAMQEKNGGMLGV